MSGRQGDPCDGTPRPRRHGHGLGLVASSGVPLSHRPAVLLARSAGERRPTGRVVAFRASQGSASAWRQELGRHRWGRLGVERLCPRLALGPGMRAWHTGAGWCAGVAGSCRPGHG